MLFRDIPGLQPLKQTLIQSVRQHHVAHAQLFHGPMGSGNLALALAFATYLNCEDRQTDDACGICASCMKMRKLAHPDVHHIFPVANTKKIKDNESDAFMPLWRQFVAEQSYGTLSDWLIFMGVEGNRQGNISAEEARNVIKKIAYKAYEGEYKILILWQPESLNMYSANALLKVLEEPPSNTIFLLVCNDANRLITTILSRTQRIAIPAFSAEDIAEYLTKKQSTDEKRVRQIAYLADGNLAYALELSEGGDNDQHPWFINWMRACYKADLLTLVPMADTYDAMPKETQKSMLEYGLSLFRDLFLWQNGAESLVRLEGEELTFIQNFAKVVKSHYVESLTQALSEAYYHLERNARAKIVFLDLSLIIARLIKK